MKKWTKYSLIIFGSLILLIVVMAITSLTQPVDASYASHMEKVLQMHQTSTKENDKNYAGLVSGIRTGGRRDLRNLTSNEFECTDSGVYFNTYGFCTYITGEEQPVPVFANNLFYLDHNSDTVIKLCGRPDCTHNTDECNSYVVLALGITYYDGYLYYATVEMTASGLAALYRMDLDGSNRVRILDCASIYQEQYTNFRDPCFINGVFMMGMSYVDENTGELVMDYYYCKLDEEVPKLKKKCAPGYCWTDGEALLHGSFTKDADGNPTEWRLMQWDPDTNTEKVLNTVSGVEDVYAVVYNTYWGTACGLRHEDGKVIKINYPNCEMEVLFETGIGGVTADFYPDCIAVWEQGDYQAGKDGILHFFDYEGTKLGQVVMDVTVNSDNIPVLGESRDRIYIRGNECFALPTYYIDKSEFGTGDLILHPLEHPDLQDIETEYIHSDWGFDQMAEYCASFTRENYSNIE